MVNTKSRFCTIIETNMDHNDTFQDHCLASSRKNCQKVLKTKKPEVTSWKLSTKIHKGSFDKNLMLLIVFYTQFAIKNFTVHITFLIFAVSLVTLGRVGLGLG